ncbi:MAG: biotin transporter BioY [Lachnospiraceae bacterium]|nr:biotin transporter BioY [Lachnospiraceae bacterium]
MKTDIKTNREKTAAFAAIDIAYIAMSVALISVCSWLEIPATVPFTLQTFAVFLSVALLGGWRGTTAVLVYILLGAAGAPVFSGFSGGIAKLMGPTGGYILGFFFSALLMWCFEALIGRKLAVRALSMVLALLVCYAFGSLWFVNIYIGKDGSRMGIGAALGICVFPYILPDLLKIAAACFISSNKTLRRTVRSAG